MRKLSMCAGCVLLLLLQQTCAAADEMTEEQVAAAREEALAKLDKPLEKMKIGELMALLKERGVECKDCRGAEKSVIVKQVLEAIHLPIPKKDQKKETKEEKKEKEKTAKAKKEKDAEATEPAVEMTEEQVAASREEALAKLDKPLEKMKISELMELLKERGVECKDCQIAEKSHIIAQVRDAIHLPKKDPKKEKKEKEKKEKEQKDKERKEKKDKERKEKEQKEKEKKQKNVDKKEKNGKAKKEKDEEVPEPAVEMTEEQVAAAREEALAKLDKPLEKMKIGELMALLKERGVECKDCRGAEKAVIVNQVREVIHLAPKKSTKGAQSKGSNKAPKDEKIEDVLSKMKGMPGFENIKVFGRDDIDKMLKDEKYKSDL